MEEKYLQYIGTPVGWLRITTGKTALTAIAFENEQGVSSDVVPEIMQKTVFQLAEYFDGKRLEFNLVLSPEGTDFQKKIWDLVSAVKFGNTASYLDIARMSGSEKNTRAIGLANGKNPIPIVIPCHRIIGSNGKLTGYAGGLERKRWLLRHEQKFSQKEHLLF